MSLEIKQSSNDTTREKLNVKYEYENTPENASKLLIELRERLNNASWASIAELLALERSNNNVCAWKDKRVKMPELHFKNLLMLLKGQEEIKKTKKD